MAEINNGPIGSTFGGLKDIFNPLITQVVDEAAKVATSIESDKVAADLGYVTHTPLTPDEKMTSIRDLKPATAYSEMAAPEVGTRSTGYEKSSKLFKFGVDLAVTDEFVAWLQSGETLAKADSSVKRMWDAFGNDTVAGIRSLDKSKSILMTSVLGFGGSALDYGPGSAGGDGVALFSGSHPNGGFAFDNDDAVALAGPALLAAIKKMKAYKTETGEPMETAEVFTLVIPEALADTAMALMNSGGMVPGMYAGTGSNSNLVNTFFFQGFRVEVVINKRIGTSSFDVLKNVNGLTGNIGSDTAWYLLNKQGIKNVRGFQMWSMWDKRVKLWRDDKTDTSYVRINSYMNADSFNVAQYVQRGNV
jgi:hypothetical protein